MKNKIAVYTNSLSDNLPIIEEIKNFFCSTQQCTDFQIFCDLDLLEHVDFAIMQSYYMQHYDGIVIFLDFDDLLLYKDSFIGEAYGFVNLDKPLDFALNSTLLQHHNIITYKNKIMEIVTNEIRQSIKQ